jgi:hypothetical protein
MRVKLCARCPYTPRDLAHHYDPEAPLYACAKCDSEQEFCEIMWRQTCSTEIETSSVAESSVAPFARESLASSAITAHEPRSAPGNASTTSRHGATTTQDGCGAFAPPDGTGGGNPAWLLLARAFIDQETIC